MKGKEQRQARQLWELERWGREKGEEEEEAEEDEVKNIRWLSGRKGIFRCAKPLWDGAARCRHLPSCPRTPAAPTATTATTSDQDTQDSAVNSRRPAPPRPFASNPRARPWVAFCLSRNACDLEAKSLFFLRTPPKFPHILAAWPLRFFSVQTFVRPPVSPDWLVSTLAKCLCSPTTSHIFCHFSPLFLTKEICTI